jgi:hypothetical protein
MDSRAVYAWGRGGLAAAWVAVMLAAAGCGSGGPTKPTGHLEGAVTLDGQPIIRGTISFFPQQKGQAQPSKAQIVDGHYKAEGVPLGKVLVRISATKETGKEIAIPHSNEKYAETVSIIPPKYRSGISLQISADTKTHDFQLSSK